MTKALLSVFSILTLACVAILPASAETGAATPWQLGFQTPASPSAEHLQDFHNMMLYIITAVTLFVLVLLVYVILRYNKHVNPIPKQFSHNVLIEVLWTALPVVVLIVIAIPSFQMLYFLDRTEDPEMTLKVTGYQWYWGYEYPDNEGINFMSYMIADEDIDTNKDQKRLLSTDNKIVLPIDTNIALQITAADVIHSWAVPALGIKLDAVPGRLNETWVNITKPGVYYGQCSELCGKDHSYMPIEVHAVTKEEFKDWVKKAKEEFTWQTTPTQAKFAYLETR